jgi:molecular chaperone GrpE
MGILTKEIFSFIYKEVTLKKHMNNEEEQEKGNEKNTPETTDIPAIDEAPETDDVEFEEINEDGELDARATTKKLREKIKKLEAEKKEYLDLSQRTRADYMNFKKEVDAERISMRKYSNKKLIEEILPVLDAYDMAQSNSEAWEAVDKNWRVGIEYIFGQLRTVLEKEGVTQFGKVGDHFDPHLHESMETVAVTDESKNDTIVRILQNGYKMGDAVLRPARVHTGHFTATTE